MIDLKGLGVPAPQNQSGVGHTPVRLQTALYDLGRVAGYERRACRSNYAYTSRHSLPGPASAFRSNGLGRRTISALRFKPLGEHESDIAGSKQAVELSAALEECTRERVPSSGP